MFSTAALLVVEHGLVILRATISDELRRSVITCETGTGELLLPPSPEEAPLRLGAFGSSRETVTQALDELQRTGSVTRRGSTYLLHASAESLGATEAVLM